MLGFSVSFFFLRLAVQLQQLFVIFEKKLRAISQIIYGFMATAKKPYSCPTFNKVTKLWVERC